MYINQFANNNIETAQSLPYEFVILEIFVSIYFNDSNCSKQTRLQSQGVRNKDPLLGILEFNSIEF